MKKLSVLAVLLFFGFEAANFLVQSHPAGSPQDFAQWAIKHPIHALKGLVLKTY